jgi:hypothetical protein
MEYKIRGFIPVGQSSSGSPDMAEGGRGTWRGPGGGGYGGGKVAGRGRGKAEGVEFKKVPTSILLQSR